MNGFKPVVTRVEVVERQTTLLPKVALEKSVGKLELVSEPPGADFKIVRSPSQSDHEMGELVKVGKTPFTVDNLDTGDYNVLLTMAGWPPHSEKVKVEASRSTAVSAIFANGGINISSDPIGAEIWAAIGANPSKKRGLTPLTIPDLPPGRHQIEVRYRDWAPIKRTVEVKGNVTQNLEFSWKRSMVTFTSDPEGAAIYRDHRRIGANNTVTPFSEEMPEGDYTFEARFNGLNSVAQTAYVDGIQAQAVDFPFAYGSVSIESTPPGAAVIANGQPIGRTPLTRNLQTPGTYSYTISKENFKSANLSGIVEPGGKLAFNANLIPNLTPNINRNFTNGVGQKMIWFNNLNGWVADTETLQSAYEMVTKSNPSDTKNPAHPVDSVNWYDATRYCETLTTLEASLGNVPAGYIYRLPTDQEWSSFAGEPSLTGEITSAYTRHQSSQPAGSAAPNQFGLYDIRGNVTEWVQDWYSQQIVNLAEKEGALARKEWIGTDRKVLRGGSWLRSTQVDLAIAYRRGGNPSQKDANDVGFRVVLMPK
jgi:Sulfatase-modifying factor enzyme 1/PEGA domain